MIAARYPGHGVIGEEFPDTNPDAEHVWVIDPIDGPRSFIIRVPLFTTLVALVRDGVPVLRAIDLPATSDRRAAGVGWPTTFNGDPSRCRPCDDTAPIGSASGPAWA